ncbi:hypothetical protein MMC08_008565 [Hypocenomyce scalaris]|nr:hypothetical protein [Hypocenomyce scalaris]
MGDAQLQSDESRTTAYLDSLSGYNVNPLWTVMEAAVPPKPAPKAVPHLWNYETIRPKLLEAAKLIAAEQAERRVLMLTNPKLSEFGSFRKRK